MERRILDLARKQNEVDDARYLAYWLTLDPRDQALLPKPRKS